jgi:hypothetical protein
MFQTLPALKNRVDPMPLREGARAVQGKACPDVPVLGHDGESGAPARPGPDGWMRAAARVKIGTVRADDRSASTAENPNPRSKMAMVNQ